MTQHPIIGITTWSIDARAGVYPRSWGVGERYVRAVGEAGGTPQLVPLLGEASDVLRRIYDALDGILLPGGADIDPSAYGAERSRMCGAADPDRDLTELTLTRWAIGERKPVLGICRGMQLINVAAGGTLHQDIGAERPGAIEHDHQGGHGEHAHELLVHDVELAAGSRAATILGAGRLRVNSTHHQAIARIAPSLVASALAPDGVVEGVEGRDHAFLLGVQWHPEDLTERDPRMRRIFAAFVQAAGSGL